jgi:hypothetical protein
MKKFEVITYSTCITRYEVMADNRDEAEEKYCNGSFLNSRDIDFQDEEIDGVYELDEEGNRVDKTALNYA